MPARTSASSPGTEAELAEVASAIRLRNRRAGRLRRGPPCEPGRCRSGQRDGGGARLARRAGEQRRWRRAGPFALTSASQLDDAFHFNVTTAFELVKAAVPHLLEHEGSSIVNVSSNMRHLVQRGLLVYGTVKAALSHLTRLLAADLAPRIASTRSRRASSIPRVSSSTRLPRRCVRRVVAATPLGRLARPQDVAWAVVRLASRASSYVTGQVIDLDGGATRRRFSATSRTSIAAESRH